LTELNGAEHGDMKLAAELLDEIEESSSRAPKLRARCVRCRT
jgi:hypothetical protein